MHFKSYITMTHRCRVNTIEPLQTILNKGIMPYVDIINL